MTTTVRTASDLSPRHVSRLLFTHSVAIIGTFVWGVSWTALGVFAVSFYLRHFAVAAFYHRYFSHRSFKTSRAFQFLMAFWASTSGHKGPLSWATSHRLHHRASDRQGDPHSPHVDGTWQAYLGWLLRRDALPTDLRLCADFAKYPEILWIDRYHIVGPLLWLAGVFALGTWIERVHPELGASRGQIVIWGFFWATLAAAHAALVTNTVAHLFGKRTFETNDQSRDVWWLWPFTAGENWHNSHHAYPASARSGFGWRQPDPIFWGLRVLAAFGLIWDLKVAAPKEFSTGKSA